MERFIPDPAIVKIEKVLAEWFCTCEKCKERQRLLREVVNELKSRKQEPPKE